MCAAQLNAPADERREVIDAVLKASRALASVASRSLGAWEGEVTLPQFRALVVLCSNGPQRAADLAEALGVTRSNATRMCDRLAHKHLVRRSRSATDRRSVRVAATEEGQALVDQVSAAGRHELGRIVDHLPAAERDGLVSALEAFSRAAGEVPEDGWSLGSGGGQNGGLVSETGGSAE